MRSRWVRVRGSETVSVAANVAEMIPPQEVYGAEQGELLVLSWGGTHGACYTAVQSAIESGQIDLLHIHGLFPHHVVQRDVE